MATNPYRIKIVEYAKSVGICTQCFSRPTLRDMRQCPRCIEACKRKRKAKPKAYHKYCNNNFPEQQKRRKREELKIDIIHKAVTLVEKLST